MYRLVTDVEDDNVQRPENPRRNANLLEIITFSWLLNLFKTGRKKDLEDTDLYTTLNDHKSSALGDELEKTWKLEIISASEAHREPSLPRALIKTFGTKFMLHGFIQLFNDITFKILQPLFIGGLLEHFNTNDTDGSDMRYARICACGLMLSLVVALILQHSNQVEVLHCGMKMRIACCSIIYRKVLCLSHSALGETSVGRVINLLANDVHQFDMAVVFINYVWIGPLQTAVVTYFLWQEIGLSSLIGLAAMILLIPFQGWLGKKISKQRSKIAKKTDTRVRLMNEIISGIQLIKMYAWEAPFAKLIEYARNEEIRYLRHSSIVKVILGLFPLLQTRYLLFTVLTSYALLGNAVSAKKIFVLVSFYDLLTRSMSSLFVRGITSISVLLVSIKRIQNFLLLEEKSTETSRITSDLKKRDIAVDESTHHNDETSESNINSEKCIENCSNSVGVLVTNVTASWTGAKTNNSLENINLTVETGRLVAITGPVGAGKSSLLQAILRELPLSEGRISVNGVISYASQETWLFSGSIQQNILFDSPMDKERYRQVIHVCALRSDFEQFPNGDKTFVGERGVTLSGGQRARINLARAVYKQADVYLLDDPLSAVDTRVGKHLFETCITGFLKGKTCILITHQIQYLTNVDKIVVMKNATIAVEGSYQEVQASGIDFAKSLKSPLRKKSESDIDVIDEDHETSSLANSNENISSPVDEPLTETAADADEGRETRSFGHIKKNVYMSYLLSGGITFKVLLMILMFILIQVLASGLDLWISYWVVHEEMILSGNKSVPNDNGTLSAYDSAETTNVLLNFREFFFSVYIAITVSSIIVLVICCVVFVSVCTSSSMHLHNKMFSAIIQATMYFLNTNSSGTVLNRFSKDIGTIDEVLPSVLLECLRICLCILGIVFVIGSVNIYFTIPTVVVGLIIYRFVCFYLKTSRSLKRLEGIKQSSIFSHASESIQGLATIRAYGAERFLSVEFGKHQDLHSSVWYLFIASNHAFGFWLDIFCTTYQSVVLFTLFLISNNVYGGIVGLAITQTIQLTGLLQWAIRQMAVLENQIVSVERIIEYINCPQEATLQRSSPPCKTPPIEWPDSGEIVLKNLNLRYSRNKPHVLKNLNIRISPMEKVGIVGRTGAGKSSIVSALFRLAHNEGSIVIDNVDIHELALHDLRSKLSIIPQEPVLFSGTIRTNLDRFDQYPDHVLWGVLDEVELKRAIENLPGRLDSNISESGSNFSVGQRQLLCLARAMLRNNKILILDEATANVDPQTDALIQKAIRKKFQNCTVLTIAHRLNTIMDSDRVVVLDAGKIVEFDHPHDLLKDTDGFLYKMVEQTGQATSDLLRVMAEESFNALQTKKKLPTTLVDGDFDGVSKIN